MYHVHLGAKPDTVEVIRYLTQGDGSVHIDGDGWNVWGEAPGTDTNDADTMHVIFEFDHLHEATTFAGYLYNERGNLGLIPSDGYSIHLSGNVIIITEKDDWAIVHVIFREPTDREYDY